MTGAFTTDLRTPASKMWGLLWSLWSFCLSTGKYWSDKNHSCFSNKYHKLTQYVMQKNNVHLPPLFLIFFINTFTGKRPFVIFSTNSLKLILKTTLLFDFPWLVLGQIPQRNCPPTLTLTITLTLTLTGGQFSLGAIVWAPLDFIAI